MSRLVDVQEIHVDLCPGKLAIELGMEMEQWFAQCQEARDPHLPRRERVRPDDHPDAAVGGVGLETGVASGFGRANIPVVPDMNRDPPSCVKCSREPAAMLVHGGKHRVPVEDLGTEEEQGLKIAEGFHGAFTSRYSYAASDCINTD